jgi:hypothetical protein
LAFGGPSARCRRDASRLGEDVRTVLLHLIDHRALAPVTCAAPVETMAPWKAVRSPNGWPVPENLGSTLRAEIVGKPLPLILGGGVQQPHEQKERHHGGDEVGIGHFPGTAVVSAFDHLILVDVDFDFGAALLVALAAHASPLSV